MASLPLRNYPGPVSAIPGRSQHPGETIPGRSQRRAGLGADPPRESRRWADACGDWAERAALDESIREGIEDMEAGGTVDAKAIAQLRYCP